MGFDWEGGVPPQGRHASPLARFGVPDPEFRLHRDHSAQEQLPWVVDAVDRYGRVQFIADGRAGRRLCCWIRDLLPSAYEADVEPPTPGGDYHASRYRWRRRQTRLRVSRIGGPNPQPRQEHPHQRALNSLSRTAEPPPTDPADPV